jgi:hypothetical protein
MRLIFAACIAFGSMAATSPARAATIVVFTTPDSFERHVVVVDASGPDRLFMCMLPPGEAGCHRLPWRRNG